MKQAMLHELSKHIQVYIHTVYKHYPLIHYMHNVLHTNSNIEQYKRKNQMYKFESLRVQQTVIFWRYQAKTQMFMYKLYILEFGSGVDAQAGIALHY